MTAVARLDVWDLDARTGWFGTARSGWLAVASALGSSASTNSAVLGRLNCAWEGKMHDSYAAYSPSLTLALTAVRDMTKDVSGVLDGLEAIVTGLQGALTASFGRACAGTLSVHRAGGNVTFTGPEDERPPNVDREYAVALRLIENAKADIGERARRLLAIAAAADLEAKRWSGPAAGTPKWAAPTGGTFDVTTSSIGGVTTVTTGEANDTVTVTVDPRTGETIITVTYSSPDTTTCVREVVRVPKGQQVVINTGGGDDTIIVPAGVPVRLRFATGTGNDKVRAQQSDADIEAFGGTGTDHLETGGGKDAVSGGAGDDYVDSGDGEDVVFGLLGNDILYGMGGNDTASGGSGHDYVEGARGDDVVLGGDGDDILSGGFGDDRGYGGEGNDTMYAGSGTDVFDGGQGADKYTAEKGDAGSGNEEGIVIEIPAESYYTAWLEFAVGGSDAFKERMLADLQMMASSTVGQKMLEQQLKHHNESGFLGLGKQRVTIQEFDEQNGYASGGKLVTINPDFVMGLGNKTDPTGKTVTPPVVILFHELGHINQWRSQGGMRHWYEKELDDKGQLVSKKDASGQPLLERQNVGLEWDTSLVPEGDGDTYDFDFTENGFRDEVRVPRRERY